MDKGKLYLIPNIIADDTQAAVIPSYVCSSLKEIQHFLAEDVRTARRYLSSLKVYDSIESLNFQVLNKNTKQEELRDLLDAVFQGKNVGIISEAGCPGIADPGAIATKFAHENDGVITEGFFSDSGSILVVKGDLEQGLLDADPAIKQGIVSVDIRKLWIAKGSFCEH